MSACGSGSADSSSGKSAEADSVTVQINPAPYAWLPIFAQKAGFFKKNGIDVKLETVGGGTLAAAALVKGDLDLAFLDATIAGGYREKGIGLSIVSSAGILSWDVVAPKNTKLPVDGNVSDVFKALKGKKIGVNTLGSSSYYYAENYLSSVGVSPKDVTFVATNGDPGMITALKAGHIDAGVVTPTTSYSLVKTFGNKLVFDGVKDRNDLSPDFAAVSGTPGVWFYAKSDWAKKNADVVKRLQLSLMQAEVWASDPKNLDAAVASLAENKLLPKGTAQESRDYVAAIIPYAETYVSPETVDNFTKFWLDQGILKKSAPVSEQLFTGVPATKADVEARVTAAK